MNATASTAQQTCPMEAPREEVAAQQERTIVISTLTIAELREEIRISEDLRDKCLEELKEANEHHNRTVAALKLRLQDLEISRLIHMEGGVSEGVPNPKKEKYRNMKLHHRQSMAKKEVKIQNLKKKCQEMREEMEEFRKGAELHQRTQNLEDEAAWYQNENPVLQQKIESLKRQQKWNLDQTRQVMGNHSALLGKKGFLEGKLASQAQELGNLAMERSGLLGRIAYLEGKLAEAEQAKARQAEVGLAGLVQAIRLA
ncbi:hypothetical protein CAEBREN_02256 [Caenorhabditis brenneri]|uniref:Uncharacterized protein n=1 Tax=Caenorhabditis brenneri TaxID=135651 RepID=G0PKE7_CAEBE|nr:hypothetical protein CAEBREN_02256 [Caenorhabditis brenneri]